MRTLAAIRSGAFPPGWAEWNDRYRDVSRDFWKGTASASVMAQRLCASGDVFNHFGRRPAACVNFITAHDGFTLNVSSAITRSTTRPMVRTTSDGSSDNRSWNCGAEGPTDDPGINLLRDRQIRNFLATLLLSQGTPMLVAGDELEETHPAGQQQCLLPVPTKSAGSTGISRVRGESLTQFHAQAHGTPSSEISDPPPQPLPHWCVR